VVEREEREDNEGGSHTLVQAPVSEDVAFGTHWRPGPGTLQQLTFAGVGLLQGWWREETLSMDELLLFIGCLYGNVRAVTLLVGRE